jgi:hypothetical protein
MSLRWNPSKVFPGFPGLAEGIADGSIPIKISLSTATSPDTTTEVSGAAGYTRGPVDWVNGGTVEITSWEVFDAALPDDEDEDWNDA